MKVFKGKIPYGTKWTLPNVMMFTGNPVLKNNGAIVMGAGAALEVRDTYPGVDVAFGKVMLPTRQLAFVCIEPQMYIGWLQVKRHWRDAADLGVIQQAVEQLYAYAMNNPKLVFHCNYPAIGNGKLTREQVEPFLLMLPDNVYFYI